MRFILLEFEVYRNAEIHEIVVIVGELSLYGSKLKTKGLTRNLLLLES
jgi:hypothetical protein